MNRWESLASNSLFELMGYYTVSINSFASIECLLMKWIGAGMLRWNWLPKLIGFPQKHHRDLVVETYKQILILLKKYFKKSLRINLMINVIYH